jgi:hypothetical protein
MRRIRTRVVQLAILASLMFAVPPQPAQASEASCWAICLYNDWACIFQTGRPAEPCGYDAEADICHLGGCWLLN